MHPRARRQRQQPVAQLAHLAAQEQVVIATARVACDPRRAMHSRHLRVGPVVVHRHHHHRASVRHHARRVEPLVDAFLHVAQVRGVARVQPGFIKAAIDRPSLGHADQIEAQLQRLGLQPRGERVLLPRLRGRR
jgi:hypothetical protein